jgi:hypothetical protein
MVRASFKVAPVDGCAAVATCPNNNPRQILSVQFHVRIAAPKAGPIASEPSTLKQQLADRFDLHQQILTAHVRLQE